MGSAPRLLKYLERFGAREAALTSSTSSKTTVPDKVPVEEIAPETAAEVTPFDARAASAAADKEAEARLEERRKEARAQAIKKVKRGRATKVLLGLAVVWMGVLGAIQYQREQIRQWRWASIPMPTDRVARVTGRWDSPTLAERLKKSGKIRHEGTFLEAARAVGLQEAAPGGYELPAKAGPFELAKVFKAGPTMGNVTFPEGFTCRRIAERLSARGFQNAPALLALAYPKGPGAPSPVEGKWFPDTYLLPRNASAQALSARMSERFKEIIVQLPTPYPKVNGKVMTQNELITLASIVERETRVEGERAIVAGVLINRLEKNMRLECDATVQYAREQAAAMGALDTGHKERLSYRDIDAVKNSPFNTYERKGLPPSPICNPGRAALEAAARPKKHPYLFYVMSPARGVHRFSADYKQFLRDKALYKRERGGR